MVLLKLYVYYDFEVAFLPFLLTVYTLDMVGQLIPSLQSSSCKSRIGNRQHFACVHCSSLSNLFPIVFL